MGYKIIDFPKSKVISTYKLGKWQYIEWLSKNGRRCTNRSKLEDYKAVPEIGEVVTIKIYYPSWAATTFYSGYE